MQPVPGVAQPPRKPGFFDGIRFFFRGFGFVFGKSENWGLALVPIAIALVMSSLLGAATIAWVPGWIGDWYGDPSGSWSSAFKVVVQVAATIVMFLLSLAVSFAIAQTLSGPALESLVRRQERALGLPERPEIPILVEMWRSLQSALMPILFCIPIFILLFAVELFVPFASVVTVPLKLLVAAVVMGWDLTDYPLSVQGRGLSERLSFFTSNLGAILGFSCGMALLAFVPCALLLALPAGVAGATQLVLAIERGTPSPRAA